MRLLPRDEKFFDLFSTVANLSVEAAKLQVDLLKADAMRRRAIVDASPAGVELGSAGEHYAHDKRERLWGWVRRSDSRRYGGVWPSGSSGPGF